MIQHHWLSGTIAVLNREKTGEERYRAGQARSDYAQWRLFVDDGRTITYGTAGSPDRGDNDVMDGEPRVDGRRLTVLRIQELVEIHGLPAAEVAAMHGLDVADVYAALTYYYEHPDEIASIQEYRENREQTARDAGVPTIGDLAADHEETEPDDTESA